MSNIFDDAKSVGLYVAEQHLKNPDAKKNGIFNAWEDVKAVLKFFYGQNLFNKNELKLRKIFVNSYTKNIKGNGTIQR